VTVTITGTQVRQLLFGTKVTRNAAALPASTAGNLFTVAGGRVLLTGIVGEVTTVIQTQANATKLTMAPVVGTAVDLCATLDITGKEVGALLGITGTLATAMVGVNAGATVYPGNRMVLPIGNLQLTCAATSTGQIKWLVTYLPLDDGATVVAA
jgi:hypothetical protein